MLGQLIDEVERQRRRATASARRAARHGGVTDEMRESFRETVTRTAAHPNLFRLLVRLIADGLIAAIEGLLIGHLDGHHLDVEEILDALMLFALGVPAAARRRTPGAALGGKQA